MLHARGLRCGGLPGRARLRRLRERFGNPRLQSHDPRLSESRRFLRVKAHATVYQMQAQRALREIADDRQCAVRALSPVIAAQRHAAVVEDDPSARHQLRMHQNEPAIRVVLRRAGFARHVAANAKARTDRGPRAAVDHIAHHINELARRAH